MSLLHISARLHSSYNPSREASRFVEALMPDYIPAFIIITEPGESWMVEYFRARCPTSCLIALRYSNTNFIEYDHLWDYVWRPSNSISIIHFLLSIIPEEYLHVSLIAPWKPADSVWPEQAELVWKGISGFVKTQQSQINTRGGFGKTWLRNMTRTVEYAEHLIQPVYTEQDVFLSAAGPSLEKSFFQYRKDLYLCAVSSSLSFLSSRSIVPDICIATDGGYWAMDHFRRASNDMILAIPLEAAVPRIILETNPLVLLNYGSALEGVLSGAVGFNTEPAERNGTVAGTAARYALAHTSGSVYAAGLDLAPSTSFTHARPHSSDIVAYGSDRLSPISTSLFQRNLNSYSLALYTSWFSKRDSDFKSRFYRVDPVPFIIDGITTVKSIPTRIVNQNKGIVIPSVVPISRSLRINALKSVMFEITEKISEFLDPELFTILTAPEQTIQEPLAEAALELIQLASFGEYLRALKDVRSENLLSARDSLFSMCTKSKEYVEQLLSDSRRQSE